MKHNYTDLTELAISLILDELRKAENKFPWWPEDVVHASSIMCEEAGETIKAALDCAYRGLSKDQVIKEAAQTGAMVIRLIVGLVGKEAHDERSTDQDHGCDNRMDRT